MRTSRERTPLYGAAVVSFIVASATLAPAAPQAQNAQQQQQQRIQQQLQQQQQQQLLQQQLQQQQQADQQQRQQQQQSQQQNAADAAQLNGVNAQAAKARAELKKAQVSLQAATHKFESSIDSKPDVQAALKDLKQAQDALQSATSQATDSLKTIAQYQKAVADAREAHSKVESLRGNPSASPQERYSAATASLAANKAVTAFESTALGADPRVAEARTKLTASNEALKKARDNYSGVMHEDPAWKAASADVQQKQKDVAEADSKVADAKKAIVGRIASRSAAGNTQSPLNPATQPAR